MIAEFVIFLYIFSPLLLALLLVYYGIRLVRKRESAHRVAGSALLASVLIIGTIFIILASRSGWDLGWGIFAIPVAIPVGITAVFGVIWPLLVIGAIIKRKVHWTYLFIALLLFSVDTYFITMFAFKELMLRRSYTAESTREEIRNLLQRQKELSNRRKHDRVNPFVS